MKLQSSFLLTFFCFLVLSGCSNKSEQNSKSTHNTEPYLPGLWSLHIMEVRNPETDTWKEWRNGMQGYLLYDETGHMALHLTTKGYEKTELRFPNFTDTISRKALEHLTNSYVYLANYTVDTAQSIVTHARVSHSNPAEWNAIVQRRFSFKGDTLILQPVEKDKANLRLKWLKKP